MRAGQLDQLVTLEQQTQSFDEYGQPVDAWEAVGTYWAAVEPLQGREYIAAQAAVSELSLRIRMRYVPGVVSTMRVRHGADTYGVQSVIHIKSARRELQLMCKRVA